VSLSIQDRVSLIYTSAGSQREVARRLGISHQKVGRILKAGQEGGFSLKAEALKDPDLVARVDRAFEDHKRITREQAKRDRIPYRESVPVFQKRLPIAVSKMVVDRRTGEMRRIFVKDPATGKQLFREGQRVQAPSIHWLSDKLRSSWIRAMYSTGKFAGATVQSLANLRAYFNRAERNMRGMKRTEQQKQWRAEMRERIRAKEAEAASMLVEVYTKTAPFDFPIDRVLKEIDKQLKQKHEPATGPEFDKTILAQSVLFQMDPRGNDETKPAKKKPQARRKAR
jgi:DNA-binding Lrp family transcriptional regulator